jgi:SAM-dependent methyltransferase
MMAFIHSRIREFTKSIGVIWQNPVLNVVFRAIDPVDRVFCWINGLGYLPAYTVRIRSLGIRHQLGGRRFAAYGETVRRLLKQHACLTPESQVLEIGCGCGTNALGLVGFLKPGKYTGMDIERVSLEACIKNRLLTGHGFSFELQDVYNREYNSEGRYLADSFVFPYQDNSFDVIFLISVFTHMMPPDVANYIKEISRMMSPGGRCLLTTFLMDYGYRWRDISFPYELQQCRVRELEIPEISVGYDLRFFEEEGEQHGLQLMHDPLIGYWRHASEVPSTSGFSQDVLVFEKHR